MEIIASPSIKPVVWIGSTRADLASFPEDAMGYALYIAQRGGKHADAKPLRALAVPVSWRSWKTTWAILIAPCTRSAWRVAYMSYMCFRRNQRAGSRPRKRRLSESNRVSSEPKKNTPDGSIAVSRIDPPRRQIS